MHGKVNKQDCLLLRGKSRRRKDRSGAVITVSALMHRKANKFGGVPTAGVAVEASGHSPRGTAQRLATDEM